MIAVNEIHVCVSWWPKKNSIACRLAGERVGSSIFRAKISFDLDNTSGHPLAPFAPDENFAQQVWPYQPWIPVIERTRKHPKRL